MHRLTASLLIASSALLLSSLAAPANPLNPDVKAGDVTVSGTGSANVTINQSSDKAIIDWRSFDIAPTESTTFAQPDASSVTLNRVTGGLGPSQIFGTLKANGQIFLVNPDGILIGKDATIDVGALVATTHDLFDGDFLKGNYEFGLPGNPSASVVNLGTITVKDGGFAALVAPGVRNAGVITARLGKVALGSGSSFNLDPYGDNLITLGIGGDTAHQVIDLSTGKPLSALVGNDGSILANGGLVQLSAAATRKVIDAVVNNTGLVEADTVGTKNGKIVLSAATSGTEPADAPTQTVKISGKLSASGKNSGETGGDIAITGEQITLAEATIDAFGWDGGGQVLVGGDHGHNVNATAVPLPAATTTTVDAGTVIDASATEVGNGGNVVVWSDDGTIFDGTIKAHGGEHSGDGGTVETSSKGQLGYAGAVDLSAPHGEVGSLMLDPQDVTIGDSGTWVVSPSALEAALATGNVAVVTDPGKSGVGDLTVAADISWSSGSMLALAAYRNIDIADGVTIKNTGAGMLVMSAATEYFDATHWTADTLGSVVFQGSSLVDWSQSTGQLVLLYMPPGGYANPIDFSPHLLLQPSAYYLPYMWVPNAAFLQGISANLAGHYAVPNLDLSSISNFVPIGDTAHPFNGLLLGIDVAGDGSTLSNLDITSSSEDVGLFGAIGPTGEVFNVHLTNANVVAQSSLASVGLIAGINSGTVFSSSASGIVQSAARGSVTGGLVGWNAGQIQSSSAGATVETHGAIIDPLSSYFGDNGETGGLVGVNQGNIEQSFSTGVVTDLDRTPTVMGGLAGINDTGFIYDSYSMADVSSLGCDSSCPLDVTDNIVGGFVGEENGGDITDSYSAGHITAGGAPFVVGGFEGENITATALADTYWDVTTSGLSSGSDPRAMTTSQLQSGLPAGLISPPWAISPSVNGGSPYLSNVGIQPLTFSQFAPTSTGTTTPAPSNPRAPNDTSGSQQAAINFGYIGQSSNVLVLGANAESTPVVPLPQAPISPSSPVEQLTVPAVVGLAETYMAPLLDHLPAGSHIEAELQDELSGALTNRALSSRAAAGVIVQLVVGDVLNGEIDRVEPTIIADADQDFGSYPQIGGAVAPLVASLLTYELRVLADTTANAVAVAVEDPKAFGTPPTAARTLITAFELGIGEATLDQVIKAVESWYASA